MSGRKKEPAFATDDICRPTERAVNVSVEGCPAAFWSNIEKPVIIILFIVMEQMLIKPVNTEVDGSCVHDLRIRETLDKVPVLPKKMDLIQCYNDSTFKIFTFK